MSVRLLALLYALTVYLLLAGAGCLLLQRWNPVAEEAQSTRVTLVRPDEARADAKQAVNSETSRASKAEKDAPKEITPTPPEPEMPEEQEETSLPDPPAKKEPEKIEAEKTTPLPPARQSTSKALAIEEPAARAVATAQQSEKPPLEELKPYDPELFKSLKRPLSDSELASCCPSEPKKVVKKRIRTHQAKRNKRKSRKKRSVNNSRRSAKDSLRSRAQRGGSVNANRFLAKIKRRIARNKRYPPAARRRRLQGTVRVSFTVLPGGRVGSISVRGPQAFAASARQAVRRAFPVDVSRVSFSLPRRLSVTLRYRLH